MIVEEIVERAGQSVWMWAIGTYRLDGALSASVEVSLTVAPAHRERGLARGILRLALEHAERLGAHTVVAQVRAENSRSLVAFLKAGFTLRTCDGEYARLSGTIERGQGGGELQAPEGHSERPVAGSTPAASTTLASTNLSARGTG